MNTETRWNDDDAEPPPGEPPDFAWGRTANPNSVDGELQNLAAFGTGLTRLTGGRRRAATVVVWLILLGFALAAVFAVMGIVSIL